MKKIISSFIIVCFLILGNNQADAQVSISLGAKAGLSIPNLKSKGDNPLDKGWESRSGLYAGLMNLFIESLAEKPEL